MSEWKLSSLHLKGYGRHANAKPDPAKCCASVSTWDGWSFVQCSRSRGYGPEQAYCKQHSPEAKAERDRKAQEKYDAAREVRERPARERSRMVEALRAIAAGHNDPRALAAEVLRELGVQP